MSANVIMALLLGRESKTKLIVIYKAPFDLVGTHPLPVHEAILPPCAYNTVKPVLSSSDTCIFFLETFARAVPPWNASPSSPHMAGSLSFRLWLNYHLLGVFSDHLV